MSDDTVTVSKDWLFKLFMLASEIKHPKVIYQTKHSWMKDAAIAQMTDQADDILNMLTDLPTDFNEALENQFNK